MPSEYRLRKALTIIKTCHPTYNMKLCRPTKRQIKTFLTYYVKGHASLFLMLCGQQIL